MTLKTLVALTFSRQRINTQEDEPTAEARKDRENMEDTGGPHEGHRKTRQSAAGGGS